ncbi:MAG: type II toxin-antitoxin system VapC family toxin [Acidimicrobiia bacterium]
MLDSDRVPRGILDTSVLIDLEKVDPSLLPVEVAISSITMAELSAGPHATDDPAEQSRRLDRLQRAEAAFDPLPFDIEAARAYGRVFAAAMSAGRKARGQRAVDLLIAAAALSAGLPLFTRNEADFAALVNLVDIVVV